MSRSTSPSTAARLPMNVPVLILRLQRTRYPYVCADIARTLGRLGTDVYLLHEGPQRPDSRSRWLRRSVRIPRRGAELDLLLSLSATIARGTRPILIPVDDPAALFVDENADELAVAYLFPRQPGRLVRQLSDKSMLHSVCSDLGLPTPPVRVVDSQILLREMALSLSYPIVLKVADGGLRRMRSVAIASTPDELLRNADEMQADPNATNLLVQEYIPGGPDSTWIFNGYFDAESSLLFGGTARKIRQYPSASGVTSLGVCESNQVISAMTSRLAESTGYRGPIDIDYRYDARDDTFKILDVNPRLGTSFRLFEDAHGTDIVRAMYLDLLGDRIESSSPVAGRRWIVENYDARTALAEIARGRLTAGKWLDTVRQIDEAAWFARDDVAPFAAMMVDSFADACRGVASRTARALSSSFRRLAYRMASKDQSTS